MAFPCMSVIVMRVLLNVAVMCAMPSASTTFLARFAPAAFAWAIYFFRRGFFFPAIARRGPFLERAFHLVVPLDHLPQPRHLGIPQITHARVGADSRLREDLPRVVGADTVDV